MNSTVNDPGLGTISFFGQSLTIDSTVFVNNFNSKAGGIYIDGYSDVFNLSVTLTNILFENNSVVTSGGAFYIGAGLLNLNGIFRNITCRNNSAALRKFFRNLIIIKMFRGRLRSDIFSEGSLSINDFKQYI